jgi:secretion/DNA translocation related TadE-like protein
VTRHRRDDRGAALVGAAFLVGLLAVVALLGGAVADLIAARQRATAAADLGALAAAPAAQASETGACTAASWVVRQNGATLRTCAVVDGDVRLTVSARTRSPWSGWLSRVVGGSVEPVAGAHAGMR